MGIGQAGMPANVRYSLKELREYGVESAVEDKPALVVEVHRPTHLREGLLEQVLDRVAGEGIVLALGGSRTGLGQHEGERLG